MTTNNTNNISIPDNIYKENYKIYSPNCDAHLIAKLDWFFQIVQEIAGYHASLLNFAIPDLKKLGLTWVISRENLEIFQYPKWRDVVSVETWVELPFRRVLIPRIIVAKNAENEIIFKAITLWAIIDLKTKKPIEPMPILEKIGLPQKAFNEKFYIKKREYFNEEFPIIGTTTPNINYSDTDLNHHVNNISYIRWVLQSLPNSFRDEYITKNIDVSWLKQTYLTDKVKLITNSESKDALSEETPILYHKLICENPDGSKKIVFEAKSIWEKRL